MQIFRDLAYVTNGHERQTLDLYLPDPCENHPLLIWVHGGAFRMGRKEGNEHEPVPVHYARDSAYFTLQPEATSMHSE